jgi:DNA topoisomerase-2
MTEQKIEILSDIEHVLIRPGMYIGSTRLEKKECWIVQDGVVSKREVEYVPGLFKIFCEILDNALDEHLRGFGDRIEITINRDDDTYEIQDYARGIPICKHKEAGVPTPQVVFGQLRTGSNFNDEERSTVGMNGVGASLTTIFSEKLIVKICRDGKMYQQAFTHNMNHIGDPDVRRKKQKYTGTSVLFKPDPKIFKHTIPLELIEKRCLELSVAYSELEILLHIIEDGQTVTHTFVRDFESFVKMFQTGYKVVEDKKLGMKLALCLNTQDSFDHFSNVNGADTFRGGTIVDYFKELFVNDLKEKLKKEYKIEATNADIAKKLLVVSFQNWNAPQFEGQTKEKFVNEKKEVVSFFDKFFTARRVTTIINDVEGLKDALYELIIEKKDKKELAELRKKQKTLNKKKIPKLIEASSKNRMECSLYVTEGDSAISNLATVRDSRKMAGIPLRGKVLNVMGMSPKKVIENKEIQTLMTAIGLAIGEKATPKTLNYGRIVIATDQDMDGYCIRCLLVNFFHRFWPELFDHGRVYILETPLYEVIDKKGKTSYFYNKEEFETHMHCKKTAAYEISYFKGLGSCGKEAWQYMINEKPNLVRIDMDDTSHDKLKLAFSEDTKARKEWLA